MPVLVDRAEDTIYRNIEPYYNCKDLPYFNLEHDKVYPFNQKIFNTNDRFSEISSKSNIVALYSGLKDVVRSIVGKIDDQFIKNIKYRISRQYYQDMANKKLTDTIEPTHSYMLRVFELFEQSNTYPDAVYTLNNNGKINLVLKYNKYKDISLKNYIMDTLRPSSDIHDVLLCFEVIGELISVNVYDHHIGYKAKVEITEQSIKVMDTIETNMIISLKTKSFAWCRDRLEYALCCMHCNGKENNYNWNKANQSSAPYNYLNDGQTVWDEKKLTGIDYGRLGLTCIEASQAHKQIIGNDLIINYSCSDSVHCDDTVKYNHMYSTIIVCGFMDWIKGHLGIASSGRSSVTKSTNKNGYHRISHNDEEVYEQDEDGTILKNKMKIGLIKDHPSIVWKEARLDGSDKKCIVKIHVPHDAHFMRSYSAYLSNSHLLEGKIRVSQGIVLDILDYNSPDKSLGDVVARSLAQQDFYYRVGAVVYPDKFDMTNACCSSGIHAFENINHVFTYSDPSKKVEPHEIIEKIMPRETSKPQDLIDELITDAHISADEVVMHASEMYRLAVTCRHKNDMTMYKNLLERSIMLSRKAIDRINRIKPVVDISKPMICDVLLHNVEVAIKQANDGLDFIASLNGEEVKNDEN